MIWLFIKESYRIQNFSLGQTTAITEATRGVETMVKEIREALPADTGAYSIESADNFELIFYADYDRDQAIEKIRYFLVGSDFNKGVTEASGSPLAYLPEDEIVTTISRYVRNEADEPVFVYYNGDYPGDVINNPLSTPVDVVQLKLIHVYLKINVFPEQAPQDFELESDVQIRNLKDNL